MKKKRIVSFVLVSIAFIAAAIITSCSSEFEDDMIDYTSIQQKERIEELAKEYGLNVNFDKTFATRTGEVSMSEIEEEFKKMYSIIGQYDLINKGENGRILLESFNKNLLAPTSMPNEPTEKGKASIYSVEQITKQENGQNVNYYVTFKVDIKWDITIHNVAYIDTISVTHFSQEIPKTISDKNAQITGIAPGIINFSAIVCLYGFFYGYNFLVLGDYNIGGGSGHMNVIPYRQNGEQGTENEEESNIIKESQASS